MNSKIKKTLLLGNEAVVRGALEAGVEFATTYPGTPASEIGDLFAKLAKDNGFYFEYSTNEKVALEAAAGAAFSGLRSIVSMKHYGLNVALDSLLPLVYLECPLVVVIADDPGSWSSIQAEQDSRWISRLAHLPTLEPADSQETKEMTRLAFWLAQEYKTPVLIRLTTRICHSRTIVNFDQITPSQNKGKFIKNPNGFLVGSGPTVERHQKVFLKIKTIQDWLEKNQKINFIDHGRNKKLGLITSGVSFNYIKEAMVKLNLSLPILKIGLTYPVDKKIFNEFCGQVDDILVVEELDPVLERETRRLIQEFGWSKKVYGKDFLPAIGEMKPEHVVLALQKILNLKDDNLEFNQNIFKAESIAKRWPVLCAGCPHRATFWMIKKIVPADTFFGGDIGCYLLGALPPFNLADFIVSMGAGISLAHGVSLATKKKTVAFIGDSTFFHAGIPALINLVYNQSNVLLVILDNRITAMTGHQPNPGVGQTGQGEKTKALKIEDIVRACGIDSLEIINAYNLKDSMNKIKKMYEVNGVSVLVVKGECRLLTIRKMAKLGTELPQFQFTSNEGDLSNLDNFSCPAIRKKDDKYFIDKDICWSCSVCAQIYPDKIKIQLKKK